MHYRPANLSYDQDRNQLSLRLWSPVPLHSLQEIAQPSRPLRRLSNRLHHQLSRLQARLRRFYAHIVRVSLSVLFCED